MIHRFLLICSGILLFASCSNAPQTSVPVPPQTSAGLATGDGAVDLNAVSMHRIGAQLQALGRQPEACLATLATARGLSVRPVSHRSDGPACNIRNALRLTAAPTPLNNMDVPMTCPLAAAWHVWTRDVVQPAALLHLGSAVRSAQTWGTYACRTRNSQPGARISEHASANAIDIPAFVLEDGRITRVANGWRSSDAQEQAFWRAIHAGGCRIFGTVLGPDSDRFHQDHLHLDMAAQNYCR